MMICRIASTGSRYSCDAFFDREKREKGTFIGNSVLHLFLTKQ